MKFIDEFRNVELARKVVGEIERLAKGRRFRIMEICGGHTHTIYRYGLHDVSSEGACAAVYQYGRFSRKVCELLQRQASKAMSPKQ